MKIGRKSRRLAEYVGQLGVLLLGAAVLRLMFVGGDVEPMVMVDGPAIVVSLLGVVCIAYGTIMGGE